MYNTVNTTRRIMNRQDYNLEIAKILMGTPWEPEAIRFKTLAEQHPQQRAGQIICNYMCPDYRDPNPSKDTQMIMEFFFPGNPDPFFEESYVTLKRLRAHS